MNFSGRDPAHVVQEYIWEPENGRAHRNNGSTLLGIEDRLRQKMTDVAGMRRSERTCTSDSGSVT